MSTSNKTTTPDEQLRIEAFDLASREARGSREAMRRAIAATFRLYLVTRDQTVFLEDKFEKQLTEAKFKKGADNFGLIVRLVFGLEDKKYNSRVSTYVAALNTLKARFKAPDPMPSDGFNNDAYSVQNLMELLDQIGGVVEAAEEYRRDQSGDHETAEDRKKIAEHLRQACDQYFQGCKPLSTLETEDTELATSLKSTRSGSYVLLMGRVGQSGSVDVLNTLDVDQDTIKKLGEPLAMDDVSNIDPTLNFLADCLAMRSLFRSKEKPILSLGSGQFNIAHDAAKKASTIVSVQDKSPNKFSTIQGQLILRDEDSAWLKKQIVPKDRRRIFDMAFKDKGSDGHEMVFTNTVTNKSKTITLQDRPKGAGKPVELDSRMITEWPFQATLNVDDLMDIGIHMIGLWSDGINKDGEEFTKGKFVDVAIADDSLRVQTDGLEDVEVPLKSNAGDNVFRFVFFAADFFDVISKLLGLQDVHTVTLQGSPGHLLSFKTARDQQDITVHLPNLNAQKTGYETKYFA